MSLVPVILRSIFWWIRILITSVEDNQDKRETFQNSRVTGACHALGHGCYNHRHSQVANVVHQELAIKCGLSKGPLMPFYKYEPQSVLENSDCKLYSDRSIITGRTIHTTGPH